MVYSRWWANWRFAETTESLSVLDLVNSGTIDCRLAGFLWLLIEHRASVLVAAGPSFAGKTTLLHALLDFLRPGVQQVLLRGYDEDFKFLDYSKPGNTYLVTEEISNHGYEYLWGYQAIKTFELLTRGYALGGTIHARTTKEVVNILHGVLGLPLPLIARIGVVVTLGVTPGRAYADGLVRRVETVSMFDTDPDKEGLIIRILAARRSLDEEFNYATDEAFNNALSNKFAIKYSHVSSEIAARERFLSQLRDKGIYSHDEVRKAILEYYQSQLS